MNIEKDIQDTIDAAGRAFSKLS